MRKKLFIYLKLAYLVTTVREIITEKRYTLFTSECNLPLRLTGFVDTRSWFHFLSM